MDIVEIANECGAHTEVHYRGTASNVCFSRSQLQQFAQRIEQPHLQKIAELERALQASQFSAGVADDLLADLKHANQQIEQLREALLTIRDAVYVDAEFGEAVFKIHDSLDVMSTVDIALEETK